jgi:hypothetical protein
MSAAATVLELPKERAQRSRPVAPEAMFSLPDDNKALVAEALKIVEICRGDAGTRAAQYRQMDLIVEAGRTDGTRSLVNLLYRTLDRVASHLCSPAELRFSMDYEMEYPEEILKRGVIAARQVGRIWERRNIDVLFAAGVFESLKYGACFLKQWPKQEGRDRLPIYNASLVMPWQIGVYRPDVNNLDSQPAIVETIPMTLPEVWRRIYHLPNAKELFDRIKATAAPNKGGMFPNSFFHQVLSTSPIQTGIGGNNRPVPGGIVQLSTDPYNGGPGPNSEAPMVNMFEMWVWDRSDYTTIQIIEPDVLVAPLMRRSNLLVSGGHDTGLQPYSLIQPNQTPGNLWGRSELADLIEPQQFLSETASDIKRLFGVQVDKIIAFAGGDDITDEKYDQLRSAGYTNLGQGGSATDLTPKFPPEAIPLVEKIIQLMEMISGFDNMLSGKGETGVRSGAQSNPMMKAAGAPLRDRSLIVERQMNAAADLTLSLMEAKDGRNYWTDPKNIKETSFLLADLPEDRRVIVDGHTSSPVFSEDHQDLLVGGLKLGIVDPESAIEQLPFQNRDVILSRLRMKQEKEAATLEDLKKNHPDVYAKVLEHQGGGRRR